MMNEGFTLGLMVLLAAMLAWIAVVDVKTYTISDRLNLAIALLALYQAVARSGHFAPALMPPLGAVARTLWDSLLDGSMFLHAFATLYRVLCGFALAVFIGWRQYRKRGTPVGGLTLERAHSVELGFLSVATAYSLTLPLKGTVTLIDAAVLVAIFAAYMVRISKAPSEEPDLLGPAALIGTLTTARRRAVVVGLFVVSALVILACAEHFAWRRQLV